MMEAGKGLWSLIQDQILGMKWLKDAVGAGLTAMGTDISSRLGGSVHFFIYDIIKITIDVYKRQDEDGSGDEEMEEMDGIVSLPGVVSRKKQLAPQIMMALQQ